MPVRLRQALRPSGRTQRRPVGAREFEHQRVLREDGRVLRDMYLAQVKSPAESKGKDDIYKILAAVPAEQAWRPLADGKCPLIK